MVALAVNVVEKVEPLPVLGEPPGTDHSKSTPETESTEKVVRPVSYTHLRAHETVLDLVCRLLLEKKNTIKPDYTTQERINNKTIDVIENNTTQVT